MSLDVPTPPVAASPPLEDAAGRMQALILGFPEQVRTAWLAALEWPLPSELRPPRRVVVLGVGGSAIGADIAAELAALTSPVPVQVVRGYVASPVDEDALVIASSFSGETRETLEAFTATLDGPGQRLAVTTGGHLAALATEAGVPAYRFAFEGPPRSSLAFGTGTLLALLARLEVLGLTTEDIDAALDDLERAAIGWRPFAPANEAKALAEEIAGRPILVLGAGPLATAARRWAGQLNENAKQWAVFGALPEANHNLIEGFAIPGAAAQPHVVLLDSPALDPRDRRHVAALSPRLAEACVPHEVVTVEARSVLGAVLTACHLGDWVSLYTAARNEVDPMRSDVLDALKRELAASEG